MLNPVFGYGARNPPPVQTSIWVPTMVAKYLQHIISSTTAVAVTTTMSSTCHLTAHFTVEFCNPIIILRYALSPLRTQTLTPKISHPNSDPQLISLHTHPNQTLDDSQIIEDGIEQLEDEDPVFVPTDEWKDFFANSEAKRRLAKKQSKKGKK